MRKFFTLIAGLFAFWAAWSQTGVFTFNGLNLPDTGYCNGANLDGYFVDTSQGVDATFFNQYNEDYDSWQGFAYSTWTNADSGTYKNQWSVFAGYMIDSIFVLGYNGLDFNTYQTIPSPVSFSQPIEPQSVYVANTTYTALTILNGNDFSQPFDAGDYFYLIIKGFRNSQPTDSVVHYLADYTYGKTFVQKDWSYVDLSKLGVVDSMTFTLVTSDVGQYGPNTPMYFALDQLVFSKVDIQTTSNQASSLQVYPNPSHGLVFLPKKFKQVLVYSVSGKLVEKQTNAKQLDLTGYRGIYIIKAFDGVRWQVSKIILQ